MQSDVLKKIEQLLAEDGVIGVLGLREEDGGIVPHVFTDVAQAEQCVTEIKWPLAKTAWRIAGALPEGAALGLVCRGCDARALRELVKAGQLRPGAVRVVGLFCSAELAASCRCETPFPPGESPPAGVDAAVSEFRRNRAGPPNGASTSPAASNATAAETPALSASARPASWKTTGM